LELLASLENFLKKVSKTSFITHLDSRRRTGDFRRLSQAFIYIYPPGRENTFSPWNFPEKILGFFQRE